MNYEALRTQVEALVRTHLPPGPVPVGRVSAWFKLVRPRLEGGSRLEETTGGVHKVIFTIGSYDELLHQVSDNLLLFLFGDEVARVQTLPNLIVRFFERRAVVPVPGGPPVSALDQLFAKVTVYEYSPSLWDRLFARPDQT